MASTIRLSTSSAFTRRSALTWLLVLNGLMFVALRVFAAIGVLSGREGWGETAVSAVSLPQLPGLLLERPWTLITYMVTQYDPFHLMFNMLWLAWFGILVQLTLGNRRMILFYIAGGVAGAVAYMLWAALTSGVSHAGGLTGASASVISVAVAIAIIKPDYKVGLIFFGSVKLKWVAAIMMVISIVLFSGYNGGTDAAHFGGALAGVTCGFVLRTRNVNSYKPKPFIKEDGTDVVRGEMPSGCDDVELLDSLLDKIRRSGFESLSPDEKTILFDLSNRLGKTNS